MIYARPGGTFTASVEDAQTGLAGTLGVRIDRSDGTNHTPRTTAGIIEVEPGSGIYAKADFVAPSTAGTYLILWDNGAGTWASEDLQIAGVTPGSTGIDPNDVAATDIRVMVPMVRRAVEGVVAVMDGLTDDEVKDLVADALADVVLYTGSAFGHEFLVTQSSNTGVPDEYATSDELTLAEQRVVAAQAALNHFFFRMVAFKSSETIRDESTEWSYQTSANAMRDVWKALIAARDKALESLTNDAGMDTYISFLHERDARTADVVEPFFTGAAVGGLNQDWRFQ